ncbi:M61 family metallopeptidase [Botryobacter ruber]|uniref:M61 family metallopeptidase n=1 Tax=Botryobacter ruber TaxID=2171629 RepID=UPI000E0BFF38|nr:PDZ domain-containing protein [Botryobacter ruber]
MHLKFSTFLGFVLLWLVQPLLAQQKVSYQLSFPNAVHHEAQVSVTFSGISSDTLAVLMSRSSPGRYALHEFAKNIYSVGATDSQGKQLQVSRPNPYQWNITGHTGTVTVAYTLFGDHADGTYSGIDETHAHLNMPSTLLWARGFEKAPAYVTFDVPQGSNWKVATQLKHETGNTYFSPDFQYLMDSPAELSNFDLAEWTVKENGKSKTIQAAIHHQGSQAAFNAYVAKAKKIVAEQRAVFGELPDFDFDRYTFIGCYMPQAVGDGMEHRNSTILTNTSSLASAMGRLLNTLSHEFFHAWNVERIRPASLEPFNFMEANMSEALWLAEGFTSYYGDLAMHRSGIFSTQRYTNDLAGDLNYVLLSPGTRYHSPVEMSMQAPFVDAARSVDPDNRHNTFISYYTYGSMIGLALDLSLRRDYKTTLDAYMQALWRNYGKPEKPYTLADLEQTLAETSGNKAWAAAFFRKYIHGSELPDYATLLAQAGMQLRKASAGTPTLGSAYLDFSSAGAEIASGTLVTSALYKAGLERGDLITEVDGVKVTSEVVLDKVLSRHKPGDTVPVTFQRLGETRTTNLTLDEVPTLELVLYEAIGKPVTPAIKAFRQAWLGSKVQ